MSQSARYGIALVLGVQALIGGCIASGPPRGGEVSPASSPAASAPVASGKPASASQPDCAIPANFLAALAAGQGAAPVWQAAWRDCPASPLAGYNAAVALLDAGRMAEARKQLQAVLRTHPRHGPGQSLQRSLDAPMSLAVERANERLGAWAQRPSEVPSFSRQPPAKPELPALPKLVKGEFETSSQFKARVEQTRRQREQQIVDSDRRYRRAVADFNEAVTAHNAKLRREQDTRRAELGDLRARFLAEAIGEVLGQPDLRELRYDADRQTFSGRLISANGLFDRAVNIPVPLAVAREFKAGVADLRPRVQFALAGEQLRLAGADVSFQQHDYGMTLLEGADLPLAAPVEVTLAETAPEIADLPTLAVEKGDTTALVSENSAFFNEALRLEDDPKLAELRRQERENRRKLEEGQRQQAVEAERRQIEARIARQREQLAALGGKGAEDLKGLKPKREWGFTRAAGDASHRVAVIIGNRNYRNGVPLVHYALNDAKAMRAFAEQALGVPQENLIYREDATKGDMQGIFESRLGNIVEKGQTDLLVYFSGHGYPEDSDAMLLPVDSRPDTAAVTGYSRRQLLASLEGLGARSVTVVLDACFTGTSAGANLTPGAKPALLRAPDAAVVDGDMLLISASGKRETSWMDDDAGLSLMTLYLLEGLSLQADSDRDRRVTKAELAGYLVPAVDRAARRLHNRSQRPDIVGGDRVLIGYGE